MNSYLNKFIKWLHWLNVTVIFHKRYRLLQEELERKQIEQKKQIEDERLIELEKEIKQENENARLKEEDLIKRFAVISNSLSQIKKAVNNFQRYTHISNGYFNNYTKSLWVHENKILFEKIKDVPYSDLGLSPTDNLNIENLLYLYSNVDSIRTSFNKKFIDQELKTYETFFDDVNGKKLNHQQRLSVITDEDNNLIVAGAGTGKTATIAGKVSYLVSRYKIDPKQILLISFTKKSCEEMISRVNKGMRINAEARTFHALGLEIIAEAKNERPSVFEPDKVDPSLMFRGFIDIHAKNNQYLKNLNDFLLFYLKPYKCEEDFKNKKEEMQYLKDHHILGFKIVKEFNNGVFLYEHRQILKSFEEVEIANFLFLNNIEYNYELKYIFKEDNIKYAYRPDFYLPKYGIYIEHFAIDKKGNVPHWFRGKDGKTAKDTYNNSIVWKRKTHKKYGTKLIETYSWEKREGILLKGLQRKLEGAGVVFQPMTIEAIWEEIQKIATDEITALVKLFVSFLNLMKSRNYSIDDIKSVISKLKDLHDKERDDHFIEIFEPIYNSYQAYLDERGEIDFNDMINCATKLIEDSMYDRNYEYILIDEFQDISHSRYCIIKAMLDKNPSCKLFCVGDDWQSIYRFAGSDIGIFTDFPNYFSSSSLDHFQRDSAISNIETTYRFDEKLVELSSKFILKNPKQIAKKLNSPHKNASSPITILYYDFENINVSVPIVKALQDIESREPGKKLKILVLGRFKHDIEPFDNNPDKFSIKYDQKAACFKIKYAGHEHLDIKFLTVHSAKGVESDYVILMNCNSGKYGFPAGIPDDPILNLLLSTDDTFPFSEERRLFYVAMTRTKKRLYIIGNKEQKSDFLIEMEKIMEEYDLSFKSECADDLIDKASKIL